jgi:hypothetical protein
MQIRQFSVEVGQILVIFDNLYCINISEAIMATRILAKIQVCVLLVKICWSLVIVKCFLTHKLR